MSTSPPSKPHHLYVDCARGYAVLMVIACHLAYEFGDLPYPVKRLMVSGWFGVQLFFLASCLTLLMSWNAELSRKASVSVSAFFLRRVFRIAPAYYAAGLLYFLITPPPQGFDGWQALRAALFINAWHPAWTPTVPGAWPVVPGGWSISVEFAFYAVFPLMAGLVTSLRRALLLLALSIAFGTAANLAAFGLLSGTHGPGPVSNFLFFWFPNQLPVFALGGVLFFLIRDAERHLPWLGRYSTALAIVSIAGFGLLAYVPLGHYLGDQPPIPAGLAVCLPLMGFVVALSRGSRILVNRAMASVGQVSFSAYLLHFAVLGLFEAFPDWFHTKATSYAAVLAYGCGFVVATGLTYAAAWLSYRLIERPMIGIGKGVIERLRRADRGASLEWRRG